MARRKHLGDQVFSGVLNVETASGQPTLSIDSISPSGTNAYFRMKGSRTVFSNTIAQIDYQNFADSDNTVAQWLVNGNGDVNLSVGQLKVAGGTVWHANNDGAGSGLDADLLDGNHASAFAFLTGATFTGGVTATSFSGDGTSLDNVEAVSLAPQSVSTMTDNVANQAFIGQTIDVNMSGADALTADRNHWGQYIDIDSSATGGDTSNEHRLYGQYININMTGDSDLCFAAYNYARAAHSLGTITQLKGSYSYASADHVGGSIGTVFGSDNLAHVDGVGGSVGNSYGVYARSVITANHDGNVSTAHGGYLETEHSGSGTLSTAYGCRVVIDNNTAAPSKITNSYMFHGAATGEAPTNNFYGLYITQAPENYLEGTLAVEGSTSNLVWHSGSFATGSDNRRFGELGIGGATADSFNKLSVNSSAALFNGQPSFEATYNKATTTDDVGFALKTGFSTRALVGAFGNDDFTVKVSPDGGSFFDGIIVDKDTGAVELPNTPPQKFFINNSGRMYCYGADDRWIAFHDDNYGVSYYQHNESGGTAVDPIIEWEHMGDYVREGTKIHELAMFGRMTDAATLADIEFYICFVQPNGATPISKWEGNESTGVDNDADVTHSILWRGFWKSGVASVGDDLNAYAGPVNDQIRRVFPIEFTVPVDGQLRIYAKPVSVDPRPNTTNDYFLQSHSWLLSYQ